MTIERHGASRQPDRTDITVLDHGFIVPDVSGAVIAPWKDKLTTVVDDEFLTIGVAGIHGIIYRGREKLGLLDPQAPLPTLFDSPDDIFGSQALMESISQDPEDPYLVVLLNISHIVLGVSQVATRLKQAATIAGPNRYQFDIPDVDEERIKYATLLQISRVPTSIVMTTAPGQVDFRVNLQTSIKNPVRGSDHLSTRVDVTNDDGRTRITSGGMILIHNPHPNPDPVLVTNPLNGIALAGMVAHTIHKAGLPHRT